MNRCGMIRNSNMIFLLFKEKKNIQSTYLDSGVITRVSGVYIKEVFFFSPGELPAPIRSAVFLPVGDLQWENRG